MKIPKDEIVTGDRRGTIKDNLFIAALTATLDNGEFQTFLKETDWENKKEIDVKFIVEGVELDLFKVCEQWNEQVDRMVAKQAVELMQEKFTNLSDFIYDLEKEMKRKVKKELGVEFDDYGE